MSQVYDIVDSTYIYFAKNIKIYGGKWQPKPKQPSAHQQNEKKTILEKLEPAMYLIKPHTAIIRSVASYCSCWIMSITKRCVVMPSTFSHFLPRVGWA